MNTDIMQYSQNFVQHASCGFSQAVTREKNAKYEAAYVTVKQTLLALRVRICIGNEEFSRHFCTRMCVLAMYGLVWIC